MSTERHIEIARGLRRAYHENNRNIIGAEFSAMAEYVIGLLDAAAPAAPGAMPREERPATRIAELTKAWEAAELAYRCSEATLHAVVSTIGGEVEGAPTHRGNFLQRLRELADIEHAHQATHGDGWIDRAHAVAQALSVKDASLYGRDVWHICVEVAERSVAAGAPGATPRDGS